MLTYQQYQEYLKRSLVITEEKNKLSKEHNDSHSLIFYELHRLEKNRIGILNELLSDIGTEFSVYIKNSYYTGQSDGVTISLSFGDTVFDELIPFEVYFDEESFRNFIVTFHNANVVFIEQYLTSVEAKERMLLKDLLAKYSQEQEY